MSDPIQKTCGAYYVTVGGCGNDHDVKHEECGISLEGIPDGDLPGELLEVAGKTGSPKILSQNDVLQKALVAERILPDWYGDQEVSEKVGSLPEDQRTAVLKRAQAFLDNARVLIETLRAHPLEETLRAQPLIVYGSGCRY